MPLLLLLRSWCLWAYNETKYAQGLLPIDHYKADIDKVYRSRTILWTGKHFAPRLLSTVFVTPPFPLRCPQRVPASSVTPPTVSSHPDYLSIKKSKKGTLKQIVPSYPRLKKFYTLLWDMPSMDGYLNVMGVIQKFFDQSISTNTSYNPKNYEGNEVPATVLMGDLLKSYQLGIKTLYYQNTYDGKGEEEIVAKEEKLNFLSKICYHWKTKVIATPCSI